ncbi:hypothetical protein J6590_054270, partial [Homalodisca vitripennis]
SVLRDVCQNTEEKPTPHCGNTYLETHERHPSSTESYFGNTRGNPPHAESHFGMNDVEYRQRRDAVPNDHVMSGDVLGMYERGILNCFC